MNRANSRVVISNFKTEKHSTLMTASTCTALFLLIQLRATSQTSQYGTTDSRHVTIDMTKTERHGSDGTSPGGSRDVPQNESAEANPRPSESRRLTKPNEIERIPHDVLGIISEYAPCSALHRVSKAGKMASEASIHRRGDAIDQAFEALFNDTLFDIQLLQSHRYVVVNDLNSIKMSLFQLLQEDKCQHPLLPNMWWKGIKSGSETPFLVSVTRRFGGQDIWEPECKSRTILQERAIAVIIFNGKKIDENVFNAHLLDCSISHCVLTNPTSSATLSDQNKVFSGRLSPRQLRQYLDERWLRCSVFDECEDWMVSRDRGLTPPEIVCSIRTNKALPGWFALMFGLAEIVLILMRA